MTESRSYYRFGILQNMKKIIIVFLILTFQLNHACSDDFQQQSYLINACNAIFLKLVNYLKINETPKINRSDTIILLVKDNQNEIYLNVFNLSNLKISPSLTEFYINQSGDFFSPNNDKIYQKLDELKLHQLSYFKQNNIYTITVNNNYYAFQINEAFTNVESFLLSDKDLRELDDYIYFNLA